MGTLVQGEAKTIPIEDPGTSTDKEKSAHIVKTERGHSAQAIVLEARIYGFQVEALCGHKWIPSQNPEKLPVCQECKEIYETYRAINDGLNENVSP